MLSPFVPRLAAVAATALSIAHASLAFAGADDTVFLKNGGRVTGVVVVDDPKDGVRIKLETGAVKSIPASEVARVQYGGQPAPAAAAPMVAAPVAPAAPVGAAPPVAGVGSIHVEASEPGTVFVDGGRVGRAPVDVPAAAVGRHLARIEFENGASDEETLLAQAGATTKYTFQFSSQRRTLRIVGMVALFTGVAGIPVGAGIIAATAGHESKLCGSAGGGQYSCFGPKLPPNAGGIALIAGGGAALLGGGILALTHLGNRPPGDDQPHPETSRITVTPLVGPGSAGLRMTF